MGKGNEIKIGAILSYLIIAVSAVINVFYTPFLTYSLGQSEFGIYSLITSIVAYLTVLDLGFGNAIIVYTSKFLKNKSDDKLYNLFGSFIIIYSIIGVISFVIGCAIYLNMDSFFQQSMSNEEIMLAKSLLVILIINLVITFPLSVFSNIITAYEKFIFSKTLNLIRIIIQPLLMTPILLLGYRSFSLVCIITIINITILIINLLYCKKVLNVKIKFKYFDKLLFKEIFGYSFYIFLSLLIVQLNWNIDNLIIGIFWGPSLVAIYSVALQILNVFGLLGNTISNILLPHISKMESSKASSQKFEDILSKTGNIQFFLVSLIMSGFIIYGDELFAILFGSDYSECYILLIILMLPSCIAMIQVIAIDILQAKNKYRFRTLLFASLSFINVIASIFLVKNFKCIGAAVSTSSTVLLCEVIMSVYYHKKLNLNMLAFWKNILIKAIPSIIVFAFGLLVNILINSTNILVFLIQILIYTLIYCIIMFRFNMNEEEKNLLKEVFFIDKLGKKKNE